MSEAKEFLAEHNDLSRRFFLRSGAALAAGSALAANARSVEPPAELAPVLEKLESYFTTQAKFGDVSRGKPIPHALPLEKKKEVGLTRETWKLDIVADPDNPAADERGYVKLPNVNVLIEMADMREANRTYEANLQMVKQVRDMLASTIDLLRA